MSRWKLHTPEGVQDILQDECIAKREVEQRVASVFEGYGYHEVQTPTLEFYDVFSSESGLIEQETMFKFFDHEGRILVLRPDITTPIARMVATKCQELTCPARFCYIGNAFRYAEPYQGARLREFTQAGIELMGNNSPEADAEVIAVTIHALLASGLEDFQIEIGQVAFFKGLMEQSGLSEEYVEKLRALIDSKDTLGIEELVQGFDMAQELKDIIISLPTQFGGIEIIDEVEKKVQSNESSLNALNNLRQVYNILIDYGFEKYVSVDLGMVQSINYYTGIIFKGFTHGLGFPVCGGGRYDKLLSEFGKEMSATGVAIGINRLLSALHRQKVQFRSWHVDSLICYTGENRKLAFEIAHQLRMQGLIMEMYLGEDTEEEAVRYARNKNIDGIIRVGGQDEIELHNLLENEKATTTLENLMNR